MTINRKFMRIAVSVFFTLTIVCILGFIAVFDVFSWQKLDPARLTALAQTTSLYDRNGNLITDIRGVENRINVSLDKVPEHTRYAFLAAEDLRFYEHNGIDLFRILGALRSNIISGSFAEGASTITQQLAKLTHLSMEKTVRRKLEEISIAFQIENMFSKDEILEM